MSGEAPSPRHAHDAFETRIVHAVHKFGEKRLHSLCRSVRHTLQRREPVGLYEEYDHRSLWDEFCHWIKIGPDGPSWQKHLKATVGAICFDKAEKIASDEAALIFPFAAAKAMDVDENEVLDLAGQYAREVIGQVLYERLAELAQDRKIEHLIPLGLR